MALTTDEYRQNTGAPPSRLAAGSLWSLAALGILILAGLLTRLPAFDGRPLWNDELWRAVVVLDPHYFHNYFFSPDVESAITSPLYALFIKTMSAFYVGPNTLRLSSLLPGLLTPLAAFLTVRKAGGSVALAFVAGLAFALNEEFISYSDELKPYMLEVLVHLLLVYVLLVVLPVRMPKFRVWTVLFLALLLAIFTTETAVLLLPAFGVTLLAHFALRRDLKSAAILIAGFAGIGILVGILYLLVWHQGTGSGMLAYWADGFRAAGQSYFAFLRSQFFAMWRAASELIIVYPFEAVSSLAVLAIALVWAFFRGIALRAPMRDILIFYAVLFVTFAIANILNLWPLGAMRPNLFLYGHLVLFLFLVLSQIPQSGTIARIALISFACFLLWQGRSAPRRALYYGNLATRAHQIGAPVEQSDLVVKDFSAHGVIGKAILAHCRSGRTPVVADEFFKSAILYYSEYDSALHQDAALLTGPCVEMLWAGFPAAHPKEASALFAKILPDAPQAWFVYTHNSDSETQTLKAIAGQFGHIEHARAFRSAGYFELVANSAPEKAP